MRLIEKKEDILGHGDYLLHNRSQFAPSTEGVEENANLMV